MAVIVENAARIEADGWKIANSTEEKDGLVDLVLAKLNMPGLSDRKIGKAASELGLPPTLIGERRLRGRIVAQEIINAFKSNVSHVSHVSFSSPPIDTGRDSSVSVTSQKRLTSLPMEEARHMRDMCETVTSQDEPLAPQQHEACETVETCASGYNLDFNNPAFPGDDEDRVII